MHPLNPPKSVPGSLPGPSWPFVGPGRSGTQRGPPIWDAQRHPKMTPNTSKVLLDDATSLRNQKNMIFRSPFLQIEFFCILFRFKNHQFFNNLLLRSSIQITSKSIPFLSHFQHCFSSKAKKAILSKLSSRAGESTIFKVLSLRKTQTIMQQYT